MPHIKNNDISMYYEIYGQGEPIIFIGGFTADHTVWSAIVSYFKELYQVILFDNRGAGQTDVPEGPYSIEQMANDVVALCSELGINKAHFVGSSMGGFILQTLAVQHRDLVKTATISHSACVTHTPFQLYVDAQLEMLKAKISDVTVMKAACSWVFSYQFISQPGMLELLIEMGLRNPYPFSIKGYEGQHAALKQFDSRSWVNQISVPTLVLASDQDLIFREPLVKALADKIPDARYYCFSDCGHLPQIEYPEKMMQIIHEFITNIS